MKSAKVTPIHKGKSKSELENYRHISILPIFSKILKKLINVRTVKFLDQSKLIFEHQYDFQENKSTSLAILDLQSQLINNIENKLYSCSIFLDFSKTFDTVNHDILLDKLEHYGFRGITYSWFKSYLYERTQIVTVNGVNANELTINCGVPQGSVLGPLLFLIYINDIYKSTEILQFRLFADDTSILLANKNLDELEQVVNSKLGKVTIWLLANELSLNVSKSNFLLISSRKDNRSINIKINDKYPKQENYTKYLGVIIDNKINWKLHIKQINLKLSKGIGVLYKVRHLVPKQSLKCLYSSYIQCHVLYGILNWGCANRTTLEHLKCNFRKAIRAIDFANHTAHSEPIFKRLKILNFDKLYKLETAKMMFQVSHNKFSLENELIKTKTVHNYSTRQSSSEGFSLPSISSNLKTNFLTFDGIKLWNSLPKELKQLNNKHHLSSR